MGSCVGSTELGESKRLVTHDSTTLKLAPTHKKPNWLERSFTKDFSDGAGLSLPQLKLIAHYVIPNHVEKIQIRYGETIWNTESFKKLLASIPKLLVLRLVPKA